MTVVCADDSCSWSHASPLPDKVTFKIKSYSSFHTCIRTSTNKQVTTAWIANKMRKRLRQNPEIKVSGMRAEILDTYGVEASRMKVWRANVKAREVIEGNHAQSYKMLPTYVEILKTTNTGSTVRLQLQRDFIRGSLQFKRIFINLQAMKTGFLAGY